MNQVPQPAHAQSSHVPGGALSAVLDRCPPFPPCGPGGAGDTMLVAFEDGEVLDEMTRRLVETHLPLVRRVASRWRSRCRTQVEYEDLLQVGALGLIEAARRFDPARTATFEAFASERIRGAICDALRSLDPLTRGRRQAVRQMEDAIRKLETRLGREPDSCELQRELRWTADQVTAAHDDLACLRSGLAATLPSPDAEPDWLPTVARPVDACESLLQSELKSRVAETISRMPESQRLVLSLYYYEELTMKEIGSVLDVTESRVSQIHSAAIAGLKTRMARPRAA